jgi:homoserine kinase
MRFSIKAPASSANLGPGFDAIGLALDVWNAVTIDTDGEPGSVINEGPESAMLEGHENLTLTAMQRLAQEHGRTLPDFSLTAHTAIPVSRGMGSSAAALVIGLVAANHLLELDLSTDEIFRLAWAAEGHGDNVGAAIYGGAVMSVPHAHGITRLWQDGDLGLTAVLFIPEATGATHAARAALPTSVPHTDARFNLASAAGLAVGLARKDHSLIAAGMHDRLHEPYRARLFAHLDPVKDAAKRAGAIGASLSGAGSTVLALAPPNRVDDVRAAIEDTVHKLNVAGRAEIVAPTLEGVVLTHAEPAQMTPVASQRTA